jgi:hypothetical protein
MLRLKAERRTSLGRESGATAPESRITKNTGIFDSSTLVPFSSVSASQDAHSKRWNHGRKTIADLACEAVVWTIWFALVAGAILAMCALLWVAS